MSEQDRASAGDAGGFAGFAQLSQLAQLVSSMDAAGLVSGVGQALTWARESVVAPHAAHADPGEHPDCVICRGMAIVQATAGSAAPGNGSAATEPAHAESTVRWVPVTRRGAASAS